MEKCPTCGAEMSDFGHVLLCEKCGYTAYISETERRNLKLNDKDLQLNPIEKIHPTKMQVEIREGLYEPPNIDPGKLKAQKTNKKIVIITTILAFCLALSIVVLQDNPAAGSKRVTEPQNAVDQEKLQEIISEQNSNNINAGNLLTDKEILLKMVTTAAGDPYKDEEGKQLLSLPSYQYESANKFYFFQAEDGNYYVNYQRSAEDEITIKSKYDSVTLDDLSFMDYLQIIGVILPDDAEITEEEIDNFAFLDTLVIENYSGDLSFFDELTEVNNIMVNGQLIKGEVDTEALETMSEVITYNEPESDVDESTEESIEETNE